MSSERENYPHRISPSIILLCESGPLQGREYVVDKPSFRIGASADNDLVIASDDYVSRTHACLFCDGDRVTVVDRGSTNGTFLNGKRLGDSAIYVNPGDRLKMGASTFLAIPVAGDASSAPDESETKMFTSVNDAVKQATEAISLENLINGFSGYIQKGAKLLRHPFTYAYTLDVAGKKAFKDALLLVVYAITIIFFLLTPVFATHKDQIQISKVSFLIRHLFQFTLYGLLIHLGLRFIGRSKRPLSSTLVLYFHICSFITPLYVLALYPMYLSLGPIAMFGTIDDLPKTISYYAMHPGISMYVNVVNTVISIFSFLILIKAYSTTHHISKLCTFISFVVAGIVGGLIQLFILTPLFNGLDKLLS